MSHIGKTTLALLFSLDISPERMYKPNSCVLNFLMVCNVLIIFGRGRDKDQ